MLVDAVRARWKWIFVCTLSDDFQDREEEEKFGDNALILKDIDYSFPCTTKETVL